jgi:hypothetical protein
MTGPEQVQVPDAEDAFLEANGRTFMITRRKDGFPSAHPMARFYAERRIFFNMYSTSVKDKNLTRDPGVSCLVTTPSDASDFRAVVFRGSGRKIPVADAAADDAPLGVRIARGGSMQTVLQRDGDMSRFAAEDPDDIKKRASVLLARVAAGVRVLWEVEPDQVAFLDQVRGE